MQCKWNKHNRVAFLVLCTALFYVLYRIYAPLSHSWKLHQIYSVFDSGLNEDLPEAKLESWFNSSAVTGEPTMTSWGAPIVWTGTYDPVERDEYYKRRKTVIGMTVFAVGRYIDRFLKDFLETAEQHFMRGQRVIYYVLVDNVSKVPALKLSPERTMTVLHVPKFSRWQDISMMRMGQISTLIQERIRHEVTYLFCLDVDLLFVGHFGPEALGDLVAQLQAGVYPNAPKSFTFEQRPQSAAYIAPGQGDYYYHAALFGGRPELVYNLTRACMAGVSKDKVTGIEAVWHEESI